MDGFKATGEESTAARLRRQEEIFQMTSAVLSEEVSTSVMQTTPRPPISTSTVYSHTHHDNTSRGKETPQPSTDQVRYIIS